MVKNLRGSINIDINMTQKRIFHFSAVHQVFLILIRQFLKVFLYLNRRVFIIFCNTFNI